MQAAQRWIYAARPLAAVGAEHFRLETFEMPAVGRGEVRMQAEYFSVDPYMRIQQAERVTYDAPHPLGIVQQGAVVGRVIEIGAEVRSLAPGDWVSAYSGWQTQAVLPASAVQRIDAAVTSPTYYLSVLGMPGRTAWFGLMEAGRPQPGDTVVVSGAAGAVGSLVVQFAKRAGCTVVGIAGGKSKCDFVRDTLGADIAVDYRKHATWQSLSAQLHERAGGVDVYFDNVGGLVTDAVLPLIKRRARVVICGQISQYDGALDTPDTGPRFLQHLLFQRASITAILARDFVHRMDEYLARAVPWVARGEIHMAETRIEGFERLPEALALLGTGGNTGKLIVSRTAA
jgi:NADPH-dependent curcumin reductase CurA